MMGFPKGCMNGRQAANTSQTHDIIRVRMRMICIRALVSMTMYVASIKTTRPSALLREKANSGNHHRMRAIMAQKRNVNSPFAILFWSLFLTTLNYFS